MGKVDIFPRGISVFFVEVVVGQKGSAIISVSKLCDFDVIKEFCDACIVDHRFVFLVSVEEGLNFGWVDLLLRYNWCWWRFHEFVATSKDGFHGLFTLPSEFD